MIDVIIDVINCRKGHSVNKNQAHYLFTAVCPYLTY